jgi:hypothetical protein
MIRTSKFAALGVTLAVAALAVSPIAEGAKSKSLHGSCKFTLHQTAGSTLLKGTETGTAKCAKPFGNGTATTTYNNVVKGSTLHSTGNAKLVVKGGTLKSVTKLGGKVNAKTTLTGTAKVTGGTRAYRKARGTLKLRCVTSDLGKHLSCTETGTILGL